MTAQLADWLRVECAAFDFAPAGVLTTDGRHEWPLVAQDVAHLVRQLDDGGFLTPLPSESAALANVIEVALVDFLLLALRNSSVERDQIEIEGDLLLGDISRRPRFAIRSEDGAELRGSVPPTVARSQMRGLALGDRVRARLEVIRRQRSATPTVVHRLLRIEAVVSGN